MNFTGKGIRTAAAASALSVFLVACGGSETASTSNDTPAASDVAEDASDAADAAADTTTDAASDAADTVETAAADAADAVEDMADEAAEAADDVAEAADDAVEAAEAAVEDATNTRVSAETVAEYEALTGDASNGQRVFTQCMSCHSVQEGRNLAGPSLYGIVGREAGSIPNFNYSDANKNSGITWTEPTMFAYLERPQQFIPGTIMAFPGVPKPQDRADVIAYLKAQAE